MARPLVPDTTALIGAIRDSRSSLLEAIFRGQVWLPSVVACELYAGTRSQEERRLLDRLVRGAARGQRLLVPTSGEWTQAGTLIARRIRLEGLLRPRDHLADVLIVVSAARVAGDIVTDNRRHFQAWTALARRAGLDVALAAFAFQ
jgi:predicted nucleic acid-binding protein